MEFDYFDIQNKVATVKICDSSIDIISSCSSDNNSGIISVINSDFVLL